MTDTLRRVELVTAPPAEQITRYLLSLLGPDRPRRVARMLDPGGDKYRDLARHVQLSTQMLEQHAGGTATYAATLDQDGHSRAGVIEVDQGGRAAIMAVLAAAQAGGLACWAIAVDNPLSGHSGGHVWFTFTENTENIRIVAQLQHIASAAGLPANTEIWPRSQVIRLPFGYHRWAQTRGELLSQAGEVISLDSDLAAGLDLVTSVRPNDPPPMLANVSIPAPAQSSDKCHSTILGHVATHSNAKISLGEQAAGRASLDDVKARFNAQHTLDQLLAEWGAVQTRDGYTCPCGVPHSHATTLYIGKLGRLFSYSPRCELHTKYGWDAFGFYCKVYHNDSPIAAAKTLNPIKPRRQAAPLAEPTINYRTKAQEADADRKRAQRRQAAEQLRDTLLGRAAIDDDLPWQARLILDTHLQLAGQRGWHRASIARIAEMLGKGERWVQRFNNLYLVDIYVSRAQPDTRNTAFWTLLDKPLQRAATPEAGNSGVIGFDAENAERSPESILDHDLNSDLRACEPRATPPAESVYPPTLPAWQMSLVELYESMSDAELAAHLARKHGELQPVATPEKGETSQNFTAKKAPECETLQDTTPKALLTLNTEQPEPRAVEPVFLDCLDAEKDRVFAVFADVSKADYAGFADDKNELPPSAAGLLSRLYQRQGQLDQAAEWALVEAQQALVIQDSSTKKGAFVQNSALKGVEPLTDLTPEKAQAADNSHYAIYSPALDWTAGGLLDLSAWRDPREIRVIDAPIAEPVEQAQLPEAEPLIHCPPIDPVLRSRYFGLRGKARKSTSEKQRYALNRQADEMLVWLPASDALDARRMDGRALTSSRPTAGRAARAQRALNL